MKAKFATKFIAFTQYFKSAHMAVDIANGVTVDGVIQDNKDVFMTHDGKVITNSYASDYGYFIEYEYYENGDRFVVGDGHFDHPSDLVVGESYPQGTFINKMGDNGTSAGVHDHHRLTKNGDRVNPLDYEYVYPDQRVGDKEDASLMYYTPEPTPEPTPTPTEEFNIGDRVVVSGVATEDSYGNGNQTAPYGGNPNDESDIRYITALNMEAPRPYHISVGNTLGDGDRGWVSKDQISKI